MSWKDHEYWDVEAIKRNRDWYQARADQLRIRVDQLERENEELREEIQSVYKKYEVY